MGNIAVARIGALVAPALQLCVGASLDWTSVDPIWQIHEVEAPTPIRTPADFT